MKTMKAMKAMKVRGHECYGYVEFGDGSKLYMGHSRYAFPNLLVKANGDRFRVHGVPWVGTATTDQCTMIPENLHSEFGARAKAAGGGGWAHWGVEEGKVAVTCGPLRADLPHVMVNGHCPIEAELHDFVDGSEVAEAVFRADDVVGYDEEWSDAFWTEFRATGVPV